MEKDIIDIVVEKEFIQLTSDERKELAELCSTEVEFNHLKHVLVKVDEMALEENSPKAETKKSLDSLFDQTYPKASPVWYNTALSVVIPKEKPVYRQPLLQVAAVALLIFLAIPFFQSDLTQADTKIAKVDEVSVPSTESNDLKVVDEAIEENESIESRASTILEEEAPEVTMEPAPAMFDMSIASSGAPVVSPTSSHPDGIFIGSREEELSLSQPANETLELLDLLTATF